MWISDKVLDWFKISQQSFEGLREEVAALKAERDALKAEQATLKVSGDWLRAKVNGLEIERAALLEKAYDIRVPAPQLVRESAPTDPTFDPRNFSFEDVGDDVAVKLGFPRYDDNN